MARYEKTGRMYRILEMLRSSRYGLHIDQIARDLECSPRTVRRYLDALTSEALYPIYSEKTARGTVWKLVDTYKDAPPIPISPEEINAIIMARKLLASKGGESDITRALDSILQKLKSQRPVEMRRIVDYADAVVVSTPLHDNLPGALIPHFEMVIEAMRKRLKLRISYRKLNTLAPTTRLIAPLAFCISEGRVYLVAHCYLRGEIRQFRLDRIESIELTDEPVTEHFNFDAEEYAQSSFGLWHTQPEQVLLWIEDWMTDHFSHYPAHPTQELFQENAKHYLRMHIGVNRPLVNWIARFGASMEVVEPSSLRKLVAEFLRQAADRYKE